MRRRPATTTRRVGLALALGSVIVLGGCRKWRSSGPGGEPAPVAVTPPEVSGRGLEIELWAIEDKGGELARALRRYEQRPTPIDDASARAWRQSGFRLVSVPASELDALRASVRFVAPVREESLQDATRWRPVARGPRLGGQRVSTAFGPAPVSDGWARLLARAWSSPSVREGRGAEAMLRLELVPQIVSPEQGESLERIEARLRGVSRSLADDGPVLRELALSALLPAGEALLIVGEDPDADWAMLGQGATDPVDDDPEGARPGGGAPVGPGAPEQDPDGATGVEVGVGTDVGMGVVAHAPARVVSGAGVGSQPAGPGAPERRTLGEAMLVGGVGVFTDRVDGARRLRGGRRALIVIVPRVSGPYRLLPRVPSPSVQGR